MPFLAQKHPDRVNFEQRGKSRSRPQSLNLPVLPGADHGLPRGRGKLNIQPRPNRLSDGIKPFGTPAIPNKDGLLSDNQPTSRPKEARASWTQATNASTSIRSETTETKSPKEPREQASSGATTVTLTKSNKRKREPTPTEPNYGYGTMIKLLHPDLRFRIIDRSVSLTSLPPKKPTKPNILSKPAEDIAVGVILDDKKEKWAAGGRKPQNQAGKLVYLTAGRTKHTNPIEGLITISRRLPLHDEDGRPVSPEKVMFLNGYKTRKERQKAMTGLLERHRIEKNSAILAHRRDMLNWRKQRKFWEWDMVSAMWMIHDESKVVFPVGATFELIEECAPIITKEGDATYETDSTVSMTTDSDDDDD